MTGKADNARWALLEAVRWAALLGFGVALPTAAARAVSGGLLQGVLLLVLSVALLCYFLFLSATNVRPLSDADGFVPPEYPFFARWGPRQRKYRYADITRLTLSRAAGGEIFLVTVFLRGGPAIKYGMVTLQSPECRAARELLERLRNYSPVRIYEGANETVYDWA